MISMERSMYMAKKKQKKKKIMSKQRAVQLKKQLRLKVRQ